MYIWDVSLDTQGMQRMIVMGKNKHADNRTLEAPTLPLHGETNSQLQTIIGTYPKFGHLPMLTPFSGG
jgi:hypothetical protein